MGSVQASEFARLAKEGYDLPVVLLAHLQSNFYPPVHSFFVPVAREVIERGRDGDLDHEVSLPNGKTITVAEIIQRLRLEAFLSDRDS